ncbi:MAG TPA: DHH family phosphoesterase [Flavipsychrobacter sp.]|nr:DHH family phosphoesterase [Flavipsychrobacter sp.]
MQPIKDIFPLLSSPKRIFITTHHKPDGDAIGSMLALHHYLVLKGHTVTSVSPSELPDFLTWMPGVEGLHNYEVEPKVCTQALADCDMIFGVDFNDFKRTKHLDSLLEAASQPKVMIDHHLYPKDVWSYGMSEPEKSSTCEMVYDFINLAGDNSLIDIDIAQCLYTGLLTDTGSFRFPATAESSHLMAADLKRKGLKHTAIHEEINDSWSLKRMQFLGYVLMEKMQVFPNLKTGLITLSRKDMKLFDISTGDTEGLVNYPLNIAGVRFSVLITERGDEVKMSFRSKGDFDVSDFARKYFNGGGHFNAAGGLSTQSLEETVTYFKEILSDIHPR